MLGFLDAVVVITWHGIFEFIVSLDEFMALNLHVLDLVVPNVTLAFNRNVPASLSLVIVPYVLIAGHVEILVHFLASVGVVTILRLDFLGNIVIVTHVNL